MKTIEQVVEDYLEKIEETAPKYAKAKAETYQLTEFKKTQSRIYRSNSNPSSSRKEQRQL